MQSKWLIDEQRPPTEAAAVSIEIAKIYRERKVIEAAFEKHASNLEMIAGAFTVKERGELARLLKKLGFRAEKLLAG